MKMYKYEATGNDFILLKEAPPNPSALAKKVCHRHFGIGADGLMYPSFKDGELWMHYFNSDGTMAPMCGNGMRCFVKFLADQSLVNDPSFIVKTLGGAIQVYTQPQIALEINDVILDHTTPDVTTPTTYTTPHTFTINNHPFDVYIISVGTLHGIVFIKDVQSFDFESIGFQLSTHPFFPRDININFVHVINDSTLNVKTFERGAGATLSCGTGVLASAFVAREIHHTNSNVQVEVPGGHLSVNVTPKLTLKGPANFIATIEYLGDGTDG